MRSTFLPTLLGTALAAALCLVPAHACADADLVSRLALDTTQARQLNTIEAEYRREFASLRQEHNRQARALRRAKLANDAGEIARLEAVTTELRSQLKAMRVAQDARITALLRPEQQPLFVAYVEERRQMKGSSRDERLFD